MRTSTDITPAEWRSAPKWSLENHIGSIQLNRTSVRDPVRLKQILCHYIGSDASKHHKAAAINGEKTFQILKDATTGKVLTPKMKE